MDKSKTTLAGYTGIIIAIASVVGISLDPTKATIISNALIAVLGLAHFLLGKYAPAYDEVLLKGEKIAQEVSSDGTDLNKVDDIVNTLREEFSKKQKSLEDLNILIQQINDAKIAFENLKNRIKEVG